MKSFLFLCALLLLVPCAALLADSPAAGGDQETRRNVEPAGHFSFIPPDGWKVQPFPGLKYKIAVGPRESGFTANINVVDETFKGSIDDYVKASLTLMKKAFDKVEIVEQAEFTTTAGLKGARLIVNNVQGTTKLRQTFYFFGNGDAKYVVTCSALPTQAEKVSPDFEACMKTFQFEK